MGKNKWMKKVGKGWEMEYIAKKKEEKGSEKEGDR